MTKFYNLGARTDYPDQLLSSLLFNRLQERIIVTTTDQGISTLLANKEEGFV